jgi:CPA1 family monovalent cation:H+ antiporter
MVEITLTTIAAYGSFALAEKLHVSGVIATVAAGMVMGNYGRRGMSATTRAAVELFWEYVAFAMNSVVFLLIGFEVSVHTVAAAWREISVAYAAVLTARAAIVFGGRWLWGILRRTNAPRFPRTWNVIVVWGGLRGALSMVLALSLAGSLVDRDLIVTMTTGVVVLTLLVQGLTMAPLLRRLGLISDRASASAKPVAPAAD